MANNSFYRDRDYIQDKRGDIYQIIGSMHPKEGIIALQKYKKINPAEKKEIHEKMIPFDEISAIKNHTLHYWVQINTNDHFIRILPNYSSQSAHNNIKKHRYQSFSPIFQMDLILIPHDQVQNHWNPEDRAKSLIKIIKKGTVEEKKTLDNLERETLEVMFYLDEYFSIPLFDMGITGSILWESHHDKSDIDLMIYGRENIDKILQKGLTISSEAKHFRRYLKIEMLPIAEKLSVKTGLPMEECFEYIYYKPYMFFFDNRKVSITFAPKLMEMLYYPLFNDSTKFIPLGQITIQAIIKNTKWGYYYPSLFEIECQKILFYTGNNPDENKVILNIKDKIKINVITRLLVYEHELVGYYGKNDVVEIKGLLQQCENIQNFNNLGVINTFQVLVGGFETFGKEYIKKL